MDLDDKGFTIIELMIVVSIIGILTAIALPFYSVFTKKAKEAACLSEVKDYSIKVFYSLHDNDSSTIPNAPAVQSCATITDATGWNIGTQQVISATVVSSPGMVIKCDITNGTPCKKTY